MLGRWIGRSVGRCQLICSSAATCNIERGTLDPPYLALMERRYSRRRVKRLFFVSHKRNRTSCWFTRLSIFDQSAQTMFSPLDEIF